MRNLLSCGGMGPRSIPISDTGKPAAFYPFVCKSSQKGKRSPSTRMRHACIEFGEDTHGAGFPDGGGPFLRLRGATEKTFGVGTVAQVGGEVTLL